jgi:hypothetical protein
LKEGLERNTMAQLRPILAAVHARERDSYAQLGVLDVLADVTPEDLAPLLAGTQLTMEELARTQVLEAVAALLEDAVCTLRRKSRAAAQIESELRTGLRAAGEGGRPGREAAKPADAEQGTVPAAPSATPWLDREPSWRARAVLSAMALPRELPEVPDRLYWAAALVDACEAAVADYAPARLVAAAVLRKLAGHERALDASLASLTRGSKSADVRRAREIAEAARRDPPPLDNARLSYCPPDPRRLDPEVLEVARAVLARSARKLGEAAAGAPAAPREWDAGAWSLAQNQQAGTEPTAPIALGGFLAERAPAAETGPSGEAAPLPQRIRELVIPPPAAPQAQGEAASEAQGGAASEAQGGAASEAQGGAAAQAQGEAASEAQGGAASQSAEPATSPGQEPAAPQAQAAAPQPQPSPPRPPSDQQPAPAPLQSPPRPSETAAPLASGSASNPSGSAEDEVLAVAREVV